MKTRYNRDDWDKPCTGCGYCCQQTPCLYGLFLQGPDGPCELLRQHDGRYWCGVLLAVQGPMRDMIAQSLRIGEGCIGPWMREAMGQENVN